MGRLNIESDRQTAPRAIQERLAKRAEATRETDSFVPDVGPALTLWQARGDFSVKIGNLFSMDLQLTEPPSVDRAETEVS